MRVAHAEEVTVEGHHGYPMAMLRRERQMAQKTIDCSRVVITDECLEREHQRELGYGIATPSCACDLVDLLALGSRGPL